VTTKIFSTNQKGLGANSNLLRNARWNLHRGWRRLIGSPKLQINFHKRATKYMSLLRKITYKDKGSNESSPPCLSCTDGYRADFCEFHIWCSHMMQIKCYCTFVYVYTYVYIYVWICIHVRHSTWMLKRHCNTCVATHVWYGNTYLYMRCGFQVYLDNAGVRVVGCLHSHTHTWGMNESLQHTIPHATTTATHCHTLQRTACGCLGRWLRAHTWERHTHEN